MHLINEGVAKELETAIAESSEEGFLGGGFSVYGIYHEEAMIAEGALVAQVIGYTVCIRSIFVDSRYRSFGGGTMLLEKLLEDVLGSDDIEEIEFLADDSSEREQEVVRFLKGKGFLSEEAPDRFFSASLGQIDAAKVLSRFVNKRGAVALKDVSDRDLKILGDMLSGKDTAFVDLPIKRDAFEQEVSMVTMEDGRICDLVLMEKDDDGLSVAFAYSGNASGTVMIAFGAAMQAALKKHGPEMRIMIPTVNDVSAGLVSKIVPDAKSLGFTRCFMPMLPVYEAVYGRKGGVAV